MTFRKAYFEMMNGKKIKRPSWTGYWVWENNTIMMHCRDGQVLDIRRTENTAYTFFSIVSEDWQVVE